MTIVRISIITHYLCFFLGLYTSLPCSCHIHFWCQSLIMKGELYVVFGLKCSLSHRSWGDAHISLGTAQAPPNYYGIDLRLINFDNHLIFKIYNLLLLFLFFWPYPIMGFVLGLRLSLEIKQSPKCLPNNLQIVS